MNAKICSITLETAILLLFVLWIVPLASARDYTLEGAATNITIGPSGIVHVEESISYRFVERHNEVFRTLKMLPEFDYTGSFNLMEGREFSATASSLSVLQICFLFLD